ncbi:MAG: iron ABC transporter permease [Litoreibacter sp.]|nr:iron ABC transporter permease [Litoreibacter sp.]MCY4335319.1 iron ABC transporter permease [Litoreibacter sp.]
MSVRFLIFAQLLPVAAFAQGFAGLGTDAEGFSVPQRGKVFDFPADHGPHPSYRIEWWYITANMMGPDGTEYGLQWTLFRSAMAPEEGEGWSSPQLWLGHAALTTPEQHFTSERFARGGVGQAGVTEAPFEAWIDDWQMIGPDFGDVTLKASGPDFAYEVQLTAQGPLIFHGEAGYSVKSAEGQASYYYSQPFYALEGVIETGAGQVPVTGNAWLDREWSSQPLSDNQSGWDWFSLSFESGAKMMGFLLRQTDGSAYTSATWIEPDGTTTAFEDGVFQGEPLELTEIGPRKVPTTWRVKLPEKGVDVTVEAINPNAWMPLSVPYWEGPVRVTGSHEGRGYLEMTGYD